MDYRQDVSGHLSQEVILAHHVPVPDLQRDLPAPDPAPGFLPNVGNESF